jgi:hypothetical protein
MSFWRDLNGALNDVGQIAAPILGAAMGGSGGAAAGSLVSRMIARGQSSSAGSAQTVPNNNSAVTQDFYSNQDAVNATIADAYTFGQTENPMEQSKSKKGWFNKNLAWLIPSGIAAFALVVGFIFFKPKK